MKSYWKYYKVDFCLATQGLSKSHGRGRREFFKQDLNFKPLNETPMKEDCLYFYSLIGPMYDGELEEKEAIPVKVHLAYCKKCKAIYNSIEKMGNIIRASFETSLEDQEFDILWERIKSDIPLKKRRRAFVSLWKRLKKLFT